MDHEVSKKSSFGRYYPSSQRTYSSYLPKENKTEVLSGVISQDHIHILVSTNPSTSISKLMQNIKGKSSHKMQMEFPSLRKQFWERHLWARGYFCVSVGNVSEKMIKEYIEHHFEGEEGKDSFCTE